jgi:hypothetical protein
MATLKVTFVFTTQEDQAIVATDLKTALTNLDAYNIQQHTDLTQTSVSFEVYIESNAKATTALVTQELQTFINNVDAYNVTLNCTHNIFNTAKAA